MTLVEGSFNPPKGVETHRLRNTGTDKSDKSGLIELCVMNTSKNTVKVYISPVMQEFDSSNF